MLEALCAFVRLHSRMETGGANVPLATDIQAALTVIARREAGPGKVDLARACLANARLESAKLASADLFKANLVSAKLSHAILTGADLSEAQLSHANLHTARMVSAHLNGAKMLGATLIFADLSEADLGVGRHKEEPHSFIRQYEWREAWRAARPLPFVLPQCRARAS